MRDMNKKGLPITVPQLAESVVSATISKWLKQPGDHVEEYEPVCEIVTDKVTAELPSTVSGTLLEIFVEEGATVDVGTTVCTIAASEQEGDEENVAVSGGSSVSGSTSPSKAASSSSNADQSMRHRYSPAVRRLAEDHDLDLGAIAGTGLGGRITRKDVLQYIETEQSSTQKNKAEQVRSSGLHLTKGTNTAAPISSPMPEEAADGKDEYFIKVNPIRNTIATRMRQSVSEIPHAWTMIEVDMTNLVSLRNKLKDEFMKREGVNLTYLSFVIKAVVNAIKDYPIMNSIWAVDNIVVKRDINISLAVGTEEAVYVPVIKRADEKNIAGLAKEINSLTTKVRAGKLTAEDMQDGTFTVNNTGSFGSILSYPIINYPQAANFTFESIVKRPVVIDDMIAVRSMANLCLSLDHRILDGVICGRFLQRVKENIEAYGPDTKLY